MNFCSWTFKAHLLNNRIFRDGIVYISLLAQLTAQTNKHWTGKEHIEFRFSCQFEEKRTEA